MSKSLIILRDQQAAALSLQRLSEAGLNASSVPLVDYKPLDFPEGELKNHCQGPLDGVFFASHRSVEAFFQGDITPFKEAYQDHWKCLVVGHRTQEALADLGLNSSAVYRDFQQLITDLGKDGETSRCRFLYPCSTQYDRQDLELANQRGLEFLPLPLFDVLLDEENEVLSGQIQNGGDSVFVVYAPTQAKALSKYGFFQHPVFCMGGRTRKSLEDLGYKNIIQSELPNERSLIRCLLEFCKETASC